MIIVTRLNGSEIIVNADLIETVESTPDTILTLVDGTRYLVEESPRTIVERVKAFRAAVLRLGDDPVVERAPDPNPSGADIVSLPTRTED
jgi:flagellar protein FlbD